MSEGNGDVRNRFSLILANPPFKGSLDYSSKIILNENDVPIFNFGKYQSQSVVDVITKNPGYYDWFMKAEFTTDTKRTLERLMEEHKKSTKNGN